MWRRLRSNLRRIFLIALAAFLPACATLPPPWQPPAGSTTWRGRPTVMAMSDDGSRIAIGFETRSPENETLAGFVVVDGHDGQTLFVREGMPGRIQDLALAADGTRVLATRLCADRDRMAGRCEGFRIVETELTTGTDVLRIRYEPQSLPGHDQFRYLSVVAAGFDPAAPRRVLLALSGSHRFIDGRLLPCCVFRMVAHAQDDPPERLTEVASWDVGGYGPERRISLGRPVILLGGGLRFLAWQSDRGPRTAREVTLVPGAALQENEVLDPLARNATFRHAHARDGGNLLVVPASGDRSQTDDIILVRRGPDAQAGNRAAGLRADISQQAISADGQRGAFIATPLVGDAPEPELILLHSVGVEVAAQRVATLARLGIGRTESRAQMPSAELLRRLKALHDTGSVSDVNAVARTLGLTIVDTRRTETRTFHRLTGDLVPVQGATWEEVRRVGADGVQAVSIRFHLPLWVAGPCLTARAIEEVFGQPGRDSIVTGLPAEPIRQPRSSLPFSGPDGESLNFSMFYAYCASHVSLDAGPRR